MSPFAACAVVLILAALATSGNAQEEGPQLYEEDLTSSMPIREQQWRQMEAYVRELGETAQKRDLYGADFTSVEAYQATIEPLRELLRRRLGYPPPALLPEVQERMERVGEDHVATYYRCYVPVSLEMETYGLYIVPKGLEGPAPLVISTHGGGGTPETATFHGGGNYHDIVRGAVARGYIVFAPHLIFNAFSDQDKGSPVPPGVRLLLDQRLRALGTSLTAVEIGKISRALDALLRRPEVDPARVAMIGLSYGGYYTLYATALEPRIKCAVSSCYFNDNFKRLAYENPSGWHDMRFQGSISDLADPDLVALICPRPLQAQVGMTDELFPVDGARKAAAVASQYYEKLGIPERFEFVDFDGGHEFRGDVAWEFLAKWL